MSYKFLYDYFFVVILFASSHYSASLSQAGWLLWSILLDSLQEGFPGLQWSFLSFINFLTIFPKYMGYILHKVICGEELFCYILQRELRGEKTRRASACVGSLWQSQDLDPNFASCLHLSFYKTAHPSSSFLKLLTACCMGHFCFKLWDFLLTFTCDSDCNRRIQAFLTTLRVSAVYLLCP